jgi:hypothetical protein
MPRLQKLAHPPNVKLPRVSATVPPKMKRPNGQNLIQVKTAEKGLIFRPDIKTLFFWSAIESLEC